MKGKLKVVTAGSLQYNDIVDIPMNTTIEDGKWYITRVPNGWIYEHHASDKLVFVPEKDGEPKVVAITNHNTRYGTDVLQINDQSNR